CNKCSQNSLTSIVRDSPTHCYGAPSRGGRGTRRRSGRRRRGCLGAFVSQPSPPMPTTLSASAGTSAAAVGSDRFEVFHYDDRIVRHFTLATILWGVVAMLVGALIALQLPFPEANLGPYLTFGRLRPLHTNAVIFAFAGNAIFAAIYYSTQRLCKARMFSDWMSRFHFWGWQAIIVAAAITLPLGLT